MTVQDSKSPIIVGLDIGTTKTVVIVARKNEQNKLEVLGRGKSKSYGISQAEVINLVDVSNAIKESIKRCYESNPSIKNISDVFIGIAGKHISCKQEHGYILRDNNEDVITQEEIDKLIEEQYNNYVPFGNEIINVVPKIFIIDNKHKVLNPVGCVGKKVDVTFNIISGNKDEISKICKAVERSGLNIKKIYLQPLASAVSVLSKEQKKAGVVVIDMGGGTTDIAIFEDSMLSHTAVIDLGGNFITNEIYSQLHLFREEEAEILKQDFGTCIPDLVKNNTSVNIPSIHGALPATISIKNLSEIINAAVKNITKQINANLINNGFNTKHLRGGVVITGGAALLRHFNHLIAHETNMNTSLGIPVEHLAEKHKNDKNLLHPENSTCFGLILYGFEFYEKLARKNLPFNETNQFSFDTSNSNQHKDDKNSNSDLKSSQTQTETKTETKRKFSVIGYFTDFVNTLTSEFTSNDEKLND